jgi:hypothetical protein
MSFSDGSKSRTTKQLKLHVELSEHCMLGNLQLLRPLATAPRKSSKVLTITFLRWKYFLLLLLYLRFFPPSWSSLSRAPHAIQLDIGALWQDSLQSLWTLPRQWNHQSTAC